MEDKDSSELSSWYLRRGKYAYLKKLRKLNLVKSVLSENMCYDLRQKSNFDDSSRYHKIQAFERRNAVDMFFCKFIIANKKWSNAVKDFVLHAFDEMFLRYLITFYRILNSDFTYKLNVT